MEQLLSVFSWAAPERRPNTSQFSDKVTVFLAAIRLLDGICVLPTILLLPVDPISVIELGAKAYLTPGLLTMALTMGSMQLVGAYRDILFIPGAQFRLRAYAWALSLSLLLLAQHMSVTDRSSPWPQALFCFGIGWGALLIVRQLEWSLLRTLHRGHFALRTVILGASDNGLRMAERYRSQPDIRVEIIGFIDDRLFRLQNEARALPLPLLGDCNELERLIRQERVDQVVLALPWTAESRVGELMVRLHRLPVQVLLAPDLLALRFADCRISHLSNLPMLNIAEHPLRGWSSPLKRLEDLLVGSTLLILATPIMVLVAIAIKLDSPGPILFRQMRYGYNNRLIGVYKFRSMFYHMTDPLATKQTVRGDPRVTRIGRFIRRTSLDELPQLFNVLQGSMSVVGPRPHAVATSAAGVLYEDAVSEYVARHRVKPGITGLAQVKGYRGETDTLEKIQKRVEYDLQYIENWSVWLDLLIVLKTVPALVLTKNAY